MDKKYKTRKELPGLGIGCILTKLYNRCYHDQFDRIRLSADIVEENWEWFEEIKKCKKDNDKHENRNNIK